MSDWRRRPDHGPQAECNRREALQSSPFGYAADVAYEDRGVDTGAGWRKVGSNFDWINRGKNSMSADCSTSLVIAAATLNGEKVVTHDTPKR